MEKKECREKGICLANKVWEELCAQYPEEGIRDEVLTTLLRRLGLFTKASYEIPKKESPDFSKEVYKKLHEDLVQYVLDWVKQSNNTEVDAVYFSADDLQTSAEYGHWTPATDSSLTVEQWTDEGRLQVFSEM